MQSSQSTEPIMEQPSRALQGSRESAILLGASNTTPKTKAYRDIIITTSSKPPSVSGPVLFSANSGRISSRILSASCLAFAAPAELPIEEKNSACLKSARARSHLWYLSPVKNCKAASNISLDVNKGFVSDGADCVPVKEIWPMNKREGEGEKDREMERAYGAASGLPYFP